LNRNRYIILFLCSFFLNGIAIAQQQPLYSQYMMNEFLINPATAGYDGYTSFSLTAREQWRGIENAPATHSISWQTRILKRSYMIKSHTPDKRTFVPARSGRVGLGASVYNDRNGMIERTGMQLTYAYHIFIQNTQISLGLTGSAYQFRFSGVFSPHDSVDQVLFGLRRAVFVPDAGFGAFVLNQYYYAGFSVDQLMESFIKIDNTKKLQNYRLRRIYYLTGGLRFIQANPDYEFEPSFLVKTSEIMRPQVDLSAKLYYKNDYWLGLSLRSDKTIILLGGIRYRKLWAGYAFDYNFTNLTRYTYGSHELMLALKFGDSARRYRWVNRY
jgi:type IX secretion system PorP/SprF family membrane protein